MIPITNDDLQNDFKIESQPSRTYKLNEFDINGETDGIEAVTQAIYMILNTERYQYLIYSWDYGVELQDLFGKDVSYVCPELKRRITEALAQDDRIIDVENFEFEISKKKIHVTFTANTIFGEVEANKEVVI